MQLVQQPLSQPIPVQSLQGDPATQRFGLFLMITLGIITIGAIVGIVAGNIAHYKYYSPQSNASVSFSATSNNLTYQLKSINQVSRLLLSNNERSKRSSFSRKLRHSWLFIEKPANNHRW